MASGWVDFIDLVSSSVDSDSDVSVVDAPSNLKRRKKTKKVPKKVGTFGNMVFSSTFVTRPVSGARTKFTNFLLSWTSVFLAIDFPLRMIPINLSLSSHSIKTFYCGNFSVVTGLFEVWWKWGKKGEVSDWMVEWCAREKNSYQRSEGFWVVFRRPEFL
jgi:hypothetical protein